MTVNYERFWAIENTREFLSWILTSKSSDLKPKEIKERAYRCLKHYPENYWLKDLKGKVSEM